MINKSICFILAVFFFHQGFVNGQNDSIDKNLFRFSSASLIFGMATNQQIPASQETYKKMVPGNKVVNGDYSCYNSNSGSSVSANSYFSLFFGFNRLNKKTNQYYTQRENRVGVRFISENILPVSFYKTNRTHYDTLVSGNKTYYDVTVDTNRSVNFVVNRSNVFVDFGTVFESNKAHLLTVYVGYNLGVGVSVSTTAYASNSTSSYLRSKGDYLDYNNDFGTYESTALKNSVLGAGFINWGLNLRLAKTKKFWSKCVLNIETRVGAVAENIGNYGPYSRVTIGSNFGLKALL